MSDENKTTPATKPEHDTTVYKGDGATAAAIAKLQSYGPKPAHEPVIIIVC